MADGQFGGNASVHWFVTPDKPNAALSSGNGPKGKRSQLGSDYAGESAKLSKDFVIRIKLPDKDNGRAAFLNALEAAVDGANRDPSLERVEFRLQIDKGPDKTPHSQIQVSWGEDPEWYDGLDELNINSQS